MLKIKYLQGIFAVLHFCYAAFSLHRSFDRTAFFQQKKEDCPNAPAFPAIPSLLFFDLLSQLALRQLCQLCKALSVVDRHIGKHLTVHYNAGLL